MGPLASRGYLEWLRLQNVTGKTAWDVVAGFSAFFGWLVEAAGIEPGPEPPKPPEGKDSEE